MLDKLSERILLHINSKCVNLEELIKVYPSDLDVSYSTLNSIIEDLRRREYIDSFYYSSNDKSPIEVSLSYKGYSYFEYKRINNLDFYKQLAMSKITDIVVSFSTAVITYIVMPGILQFIKNLF